MRQPSAGSAAPRKQHGAERRNGRTDSCTAAARIADSPLSAAYQITSRWPK